MNTINKNYVDDTAAPVNPNYRDALAYLPDRGILEKTWKAAHVKIEQCYDPAQTELWFGSTDYVPQAGVVFPSLFLDADGTVIEDGYTTRCFPTRKPKFRNRKGAETRPYVLSDSRRQARNVETPIFIVEGPTRALLLAQNERCAVSSGNCWGPFQTQGDGDTAVVRLHPDLKDWAWLGRKVYLVPDADYHKNENVLQGLIRQIVVFSALGAIVNVFVWDADRGKGLDDFVAGNAGCDVAKQTDVLNTLIDGAKDAAAFLDPDWLDLFVREFRRVEMTEERRAQLAKRFAKRFDIPTESLRKVEDGGSDNGEALVKDVEPWSEFVDGLALLDEVCSCVRAHVSMSDHEAVTVTLWSVLSYVYDNFDILPLLGVTSPEKRCGKSVLLKILNKLTKRPLLASSLTSAAVYRTIEKEHPTLLIDEYDTFPQNDERRGIINSGHDRDGAFVFRCHPDTKVVERFSTWCPKAIARIGRLESTIEDRCFPIQLKRKNKAEPVTKFRPRIHDPSVIQLAQRIQR